MAGIDATIPLGAKPPDQMQSLSGMLNVASGVQNYRQNQQKTQQGAIDLQERQGMQQFLSDPKNITDDSGNLDIGKMQAGISRYAPTTGFKYMQAAADAHKAHTEATKALNGLTADNRTQIGSVVASLPPDAPPDLVHKTVDALNAQYNGRLTPLVSIFKNGYDHAVTTGGQQGAHAFVQQAARGVLPQPTQQEMNTPSIVTLDNGQQSVGVNVRPGVQGIGQGAPVQGTQVQKLLPVGQQDSVTSDSVGNLSTVHRDAFGNVIGTTPLKGAPAAPGAAPAPGPFTLPQGESQKTYDEFNNKRIATNNAAGTVAEQQFNNNQVIKLAKTATLGQDYGGLVKGFTGHFAGMPGTTQGTIDYDKIEHFLALQQGTLANQAGFNSDASRAIADRQAGSAHGTAEGVQSIARTNRALSTGIDLYNTGNENAIKAAGNSPFAQREFQQKWAHTIDFDALRLYDAAKNAKVDPEGAAAIMKDLGGPKSDRYKAALAKIGPLRSLIMGQ